MKKQTFYQDWYLLPEPKPLPQWKLIGKEYVLSVEYWK